MAIKGKCHLSYGVKITELMFEPAELRHILLNLLHWSDTFELDLSIQRVRSRDCCMSIETDSLNVSPLTDSVKSGSERFAQLEPR
jgi:hypothetical protein